MIDASTNKTNFLQQTCSSINRSFTEYKAANVVNAVYWYTFTNWCMFHRTCNVVDKSVSAHGAEAA